MPVDLAACRVGLLPSLYYIPEYVSAAEETTLLAAIAATKVGWKQVSGRTLLSYGGQISERTGALLQISLPGWLQRMAEKVSEDITATGLGKINHILVNRYEPKEGIFPHEDGPLYFPCTCILSLGGPAIMRFFKKLPEGGHDPLPDTSVIMMPRSLLIFSNDAYYKCLHGIIQGNNEPVDDTVANSGEATQTKGALIERSTTRVSLTLRRVLAVRKNVFKLS